MFIFPVTSLEQLSSTTDIVDLSILLEIPLVARIPSSPEFLPSSVISSEYHLQAHFLSVSYLIMLPSFLSWISPSHFRLTPEAILLLSLF